MGSVQRKTATKPLPVGSEVVEKGGKKFARWKASNGKMRTALMTIGRDGTDRIVVEVGTYIAKFRDGTGVVCEVSTGCRDKDAARSVLVKLERRAELVKGEVITTGEAATADHQRTPIADHFATYHEHRVAKGLNAVRIANTKSRLERLSTECNFRRLADCSTDALTNWLASQQAAGMSAGTRNEYRQELIGFGNWCVETHRLSVNPFGKSPKADSKTDRRRQRRSMTESELVKLLEVARLRPLAEFGRESVSVDQETAAVNGNLRKRSNWAKAALSLDGMQAAVERARACLSRNPDLVAELERLGRERALIYKTLVLTGLRRGELASLTVGQLELDGPMPFVVLHAADEKNRQGSTIPLRRDLAKDLREWVSDIPNATAVVSRSHHSKPNGTRALFTVPAGLVRILNRDLSAAGIDKADERGRTIDVHALRTSFGTLLSKGGVSPRTAQAAMRHSTIDLTMNTYTDPKLLDVHGALDSLPALILDAPHRVERQALQSTGTDEGDASIIQRQSDWKFAPEFAPNAGKTGQSVSLAVISSGKTDQPTSQQGSEEIPVKPSEKALSAGSANKAFRVERKGVEPSTSALRTQRSPN